MNSEILESRAADSPEPSGVHPGRSPWHGPPDHVAPVQAAGEARPGGRRARAGDHRPAGEAVDRGRPGGERSRRHRRDLGSRRQDLSGAGLERGGRLGQRRAHEICRRMGDQGRAERPPRPHRQADPAPPRREHQGHGLDLPRGNPGGLHARGLQGAHPLAGHRRRGCHALREGTQRGQRERGAERRHQGGLHGRLQQRRPPERLAGQGDAG